MLEKIRQIILERRLLAPGERVLVGVSGGPDSVALLDALAALAPEFGWRLQVAHFNHRLRGADSNGDEAFVRELAAGHGLPFSAGGGDVRAFAAESKLSIEDAARRLRHGFFRETAGTLGVEKLALGHNADDQVETLLQRLLRGAGTRGLAAIQASNRMGNVIVVRPLLDVWKTEILGYLRQRGLTFREDASNRDTQFQRNKIRHELIPALERDYNPALKALLHQTAEILAAEDEWMEAEAVRVFEGEKKRTGRATLPVGRLLREHVAVQRRAIYRWLLDNDVGGAVDFATVEILRRMAASGQPAQLMLTASARVFRVEDRLELKKAEGERRKAEGQKGENAAEWRLKVPGVTAIPTLGIVVNVELATGDRVPKPGAVGNPKSKIENPKFLEEWLDAAAVGEAPAVRTWQPGDRFQPIGMKAAKKLQDIFVDEKIPKLKRQGTPLLVAANGEICWVAGYRIGEKFKITPVTTRALRVCIRPQKSMP
jgi:tRNA(Ile)-lysidine synthase